MSLVGQNKMASIYRFHDTVAVYMGTGATVYLSPAEARKIARALNANARDIGERKFTESTLGTTEIQLQRRKA